MGVREVSLVLPARTEEAPAHSIVEPLRRCSMTAMTVTVEDMGLVHKSSRSSSLQVLCSATSHCPTECCTNASCQIAACSSVTCAANLCLAASCPEKRCSAPSCSGRMGVDVGHRGSSAAPPPLSAQDDLRAYAYEGEGSPSGSFTSTVSGTSLKCTLFTL